jgi:hypothetical protein
MAAKKIPLKPIKSDNSDNFAALLRAFGAKPKGIDFESTGVDSHSTNVDLSSTPSMIVDFESTPVEAEVTSVDFKSTVPLISVDSKSTPPISPVDDKSTLPLPAVDLKSTQFKSYTDLKSTPVDFKSTSVDLKSTYILDTVDSQSTIQDSIVAKKSTEKRRSWTRNPRIVDFKSTGVDLKSTPATYWYTQHKDFYLVGFWQVLYDILGTKGHTITLRPFANKFGMDASQFHRVLKRLDAAKMLRLISQKEGTYIEVLLPLLTENPQEEEDVSKKPYFLSSYNGPDFQKRIDTRNALKAIFWGCLVIGHDMEELTGSTLNFLIELSINRSPEYVTGFLIKYLPSARYPLTFFQKVFEKETDPLSVVEINQGKKTLDAGEELLGSITKIADLGIAHIRTLAKPFNLEIGTTLESSTESLSKLQEKLTLLLEKSTNN